MQGGPGRLFKKRDLPFPLYDIDLRSATDEELEALSRETGVGLSLEEMRRIADYFVAKGRNPTDVELQSLGQAWSEHCCYKSSKPFLRKHIFPITSEAVLARGDAGVVALDDEWACALRIESHNHPSAVEPYGGAATGIGGIVRDVLCMGAQPVALIDPLFFGRLDMPHESVPPGVKHPKYLLAGVVAGIRDYGNRIGIPTVAGSVFFHEGYAGNCLVNVGCVGIVRRDRILRNSVGGPGDLFVLVGGRTGRDGIHGVTFASKIITDKTDQESRGAVQLGDPIMKEPVIHACLEINERGLLRGMKDLGGGGLSCVVGEMALSGGCGAEIQLDRVPLKEEGLAPWEIWVSESQERMMLAVRPEDADEVLRIARKWDVPATVVGRAIPEKVCRLFYQGVKVFEMDLEFLTAGPEYCRPVRRPRRPAGSAAERRPSGYNSPGEALLALLSEPNIACKDWVIRTYDHEVRGNTILKPLQGKVGSEGHGDASVIRVAEDSYMGIAIAVASNPLASIIDPYRGGKLIIDEMCRNLAAVGARPLAMTNCLNFGSPEIPERLWELGEVVRGMGEAAAGAGVAIPSGNVSLYNETTQSSVPPTAVALGVGIIGDFRRCVTSDAKRSGNAVYLLGKTKPEMGGSALYYRFGGQSIRVPDTEPRLTRRAVGALVSCIEEGLLESCHDVSDGGMAVALAEMCIGGELGAQVDISRLPSMPPEAALFSESPTRWLLEVKESNRRRVERRLERLGLRRLGKFGGGELVIRKGGKELLRLSLRELSEAWRRPLWSLMG
ncbi:MAG: phosphoribosylformylglycinamidine synthase subunit PurL [Thermoplasmata archaeon]